MTKKQIETKENKSAKQEKQCFSYTFALDPSFWDERKLEKIFKVAYSCYSDAYQFYRKKINEYRNNETYLQIMEAHKAKIIEAKENKADDEDIDLTKFAFTAEEKKTLNELQKAYCLTNKNGDAALAKALRHNYREILDSEMVGFAIGCVVRGVNTVMFGKNNGKSKGPRQLSKRKFQDFETVGTATNKSGVVVKKYDDGFFLEYKQTGRKGKVAFCIPIKTKTNVPEIDAMLEQPIKYPTIKRVRTKKGWKYQVQISFAGVPQRCNLFPIDDVVGVDITEAHIAVVKDDYLAYQKLYSVPDKQEELKASLQVKLDEIRRRDNPDNFNEDGTCKRGRKTWVRSNEYRKVNNAIKVLEEHNTNKVIYNQNILANTITNLGKDVRIVCKDFNLKKRRSEETTIDEKGRYEDKSSLSAKPIANNAPSRLIDKVIQREKYIGGEVTKISNKQEPIYCINIFTGEKLPYSIDDEYYIIDNKKVHRTMYYAFMMTGYDKETGKFDYDLLKSKFGNFYKMYQDNSDKDGNIIESVIA